jgi:hypothetical protein
MSEMQKVQEEYDKSGVKWVTYLEVEALRTGAKASRNRVRPNKGTGSPTGIGALI